MKLRGYGTLTVPKHLAKPPLNRNLYFSFPG
jgi:hypothetical protein